MPNQNECDHIVGDGGTFETVLVHLHDIKTYYPNIEKYKYCLQCGAKIDWQKIKEACDAENNE